MHKEQLFTTNCVSLRFRFFFLGLFELVFTLHPKLLAHGGYQGAKPIQAT